MSTTWQAVISSAVGVAFVVVARLVDRFLPDPKGEHPLPAAPAPRIK